MSSYREMRKYTPFDESWESGWQSLNGEAFASLHEIKDNPNWIAKSYKVSDVEQQIGAEHKIKTLEQFMAEFKKVDDYAKKYFAEYLPKYNFVFTGSGASKPEDFECYQFMQKVTPMPIDTTRLVTDINDIHQRAMRGYFDTEHQNRSNIKIGEFVDLKPNNLIYGTVADNPEPKTYLIDIFPMREGPAAELDLLYYKTLKDINKINKEVLI